MKTKPYKCFLEFLLVIIVASCAPMESKNTLLLPEIVETPTTVIDATYWPTDSWQESAPIEQGIWAGKQVVSAEWIEDSTKRYVQVPEPLEPWDLYLGYLWWLHEDGMFAAHGMKGQFIYVVPNFDLVVVITSNIPDFEFSQPQLLIRDFILPAVKSFAE